MRNEDHHPEPPSPAALNRAAHLFRSRVARDPRVLDAFGEARISVPPRLVSIAQQRLTNESTDARLVQNRASLQEQLMLLAAQAKELGLALPAEKFQRDEQLMRMANQNIGAAVRARAWGQAFSDHLIESLEAVDRLPTRARRRLESQHSDGLDRGQQLRSLTAHLDEQIARGLHLPPVSTHPFLRNSVDACKAGEAVDALADTRIEQTAAFLRQRVQASRGRLGSRRSAKLPPVAPEVSHLLDLSEAIPHSQLFRPGVAQLVVNLAISVDNGPVRQDEGRRRLAALETAWADAIAEMADSDLLLSQPAIDYLRTVVRSGDAPNAEMLQDVAEHVSKWANAWERQRTEPDLPI